MEQYFHDPADNPSTPPPDVYELFSYYNKSFFNNVLEACELKWSKRMTSCAGLCYYSSNTCTISLSQPLLQFRSNNELKETLLHEMIHAYLFLTEPAACQGGGHGKEFQYLMNFINEITNLNITIYHTFHDEVQFLQKHVWKCNGKCVETPPYFGFVRRAMNRAPGPNDYWWAEHEKNCGGNYIKIDGPEFHQKDQNKQNPEKEKRKKNKKNRKITEFLIKNTTNEEESKILETSSTISTQGDLKENIEETLKLVESHPQIFRLKFIGYKDDQEMEILQLVLSDQIKFKELPLIISDFFVDFSLNDISFQHSELVSVESESTLLELIMIQGLTKITFIYMDLIEFAFSVEYVYDVTLNLNPSIGEAVNYPKVFGFKGEIGLFEDFLVVDCKASINEKLCNRFSKKNNFVEESTTLNIYKSP